MDLISLLVWLVVVGLILYVVWWGITQIPMPQPVAMVVRVVFVLIIVLLLLNVLLPMVGSPPVLRVPR